MSRSAIALAGALLFLISVPKFAGAQAGTITGRVTDARTGDPVETAQVYVPGTRIGTLTDQNGDFALRAVPAGQLELRVEIIGYRTESRMVTVGAGETQVFEFALEPGVLRLQELVVTGTAARTPRVKLPFTVEKIDLEDMPVPAVSVETQLQAKAAGVHVVSGSGQPGDEASIMLRAPTTITGSQTPLIIVDGVLTWNRLADIDALDIESIEIVKGPAAASLYGSLAANGVIQVTTRRGAGMVAGASQITVRSELGAQDLAGSIPLVRNHPYLMNEDQTSFVDSLGNEIEYGPGVELDNLWDNPNPAQVTFQDKPYPGTNYDQVERLYDPGEFASVSVAATGRTGNTNYRASFRTTREKGVVMYQEGYKRRNARLNVDHQMSENFSLSLGGYYAWSWQDQTWGLFELTWLPPNVDLLERDDNGELHSYADTINGYPNPLYLLENNDWERENSRVMGSLGARYSPASWLDIEGDFGLDRNDWHEFDFGPRGFGLQGFFYGEAGWSARYNSQSKNVNASLTAAFHKQFGDFITRGQARYQAEDRHFEGFSAYGRDLGAGELPTLDNTSSEGRDIESEVEDIRSRFFYFIAEADYQGKYIVDGLIRRDGSSLFGADERWHTYYRASLAWRPSQESWWGLDPTIGELKLRYSYGTAGNRPGFSAQYETYSEVTHGNFAPQALGNKHLKPEFAIEQEFGVNMLWWNRLELAVSYSDNKTEDAHLNVPLPGAGGFVSQWQNAGTIEGHTWEISLEAALIERPQMSWTARLNWDQTRQRVTELNRPPYRAGRWYVREGEPLGTFYGTRWATGCAELHPDAQSVCADQFDVNDDGLLVWVGEGNSYRDGISTQLWGTVGDVNGQSYTWGLPIKGLDCEELDPDTGDCTTLTDFRRIGNTTPDFAWNLSTNLRWKNLSLYMLFDSEIGQDVYMQTCQWAIRDWMSAYGDQAGKPDELKKPLTYYETLYDTNSTNSFFIYDGSYLKLRELSLSYTFGRDQLRSVLGGLGLEGITIQLIGRNLLTWTDYPGYDPEVGNPGGGEGAVINRVDAYDYPNYRTITGVLSLTF